MPPISTPKSVLGDLPRAANVDQVLEALGGYLLDPKNIPRLLELWQKFLLFMIEPYLRELGKAYCQVYRKPSRENCGALLRVERKTTWLFKPHFYYERSRDNLLGNFSALETEPVFANDALRRNLLNLKRRALTLFFTPQLIRSKGKTNNAMPLVDAIAQLSLLDEIEWEAVFFFLRKSIHPKRGYNTNLLINLSFLVYLRLEKATLRETDTRTEYGNMHALIGRVRRQTAGSRQLVKRQLISNWQEDCNVREPFRAWAEMVGGATYDRSAITRAF